MPSRITLEVATRMSRTSWSTWYESKRVEGFERELHRKRPKEWRLTSTSLESAEKKTIIIASQSGANYAYMCNVDEPCPDRLTALIHFAIFSDMYWLFLILRGDGLCWVCVSMLAGRVDFDVRPEMKDEMQEQNRSYGPTSSSLIDGSPQHTATAQHQAVGRKITEMRVRRGRRCSTFRLALAINRTTPSHPPGERNVKVGSILPRLEPPRTRVGYGRGMSNAYVSPEEVFHVGCLGK